MTGSRYRSSPVRRTTGRVGRYSLGLLDIQTGDESGARSTNFSVVRLKRDLLSASNVGLLLTGRSVGQSGAGTNGVYGIDGTLRLLRQSERQYVLGPVAAPTVDREEDTSFRGQIDYPGDRYGVQLEHLVVGDNFNPEVGFVRRDDIRRSFGQFRFSPRPKSIRVGPQVLRDSARWPTSRTARAASRRASRYGEFAIEFQNSDRAQRQRHRYLRISAAPVCDRARHHAAGRRLSLRQRARPDESGTAKEVSGNFAIDRGTFYSGHKTAISVSRGRMNAGSAAVASSPRICSTWVDLAEGSFTSQLIGSRVTYTMTPLMFTSALLQH